MNRLLERGGGGGGKEGTVLKRKNAACLTLSLSTLSFLAAEQCRASGIGAVAGGRSGQICRDAAGRPGDGQGRAGRCESRGTKETMQPCPLCLHLVSLKARPLTAPHYPPLPFRQC